jgi:hypothetical protein
MLALIEKQTLILYSKKKTISGNKKQPFQPLRLVTVLLLLPSSLSFTTPSSVAHSLLQDIKEDTYF